ncbi:MAG: TlpA disulfide reductase family protein [Flavihumibacter sp.]
MKPFIAIASLAVLCSCGSAPEKEASAAARKDSLYISGSFAGLDTGYVLLRSAKDSDQPFRDSLVINGGHFNGVVPRTGVAPLVLEANGQQLVMNATAGEAVISGQADSVNRARVTGSAIPADEEKYEAAAKLLKDSLEDYYYPIARKINKKTPADSTKAFYAQWDALEQRIQSTDSLFIVQNPQSYISASLLFRKHSYDPKLAVFEADYKQLTDSVKAGYYGKKLYGALELVRKLDIGQPAIDFTLPDTEGKPVSLASFKGNYTLVDFWASWCGPCRAENPFVVSTYGKYKNKGFRILGVSLDNSKENWLKAIKKDKLTWAHVADLKGWESAAAAVYGIRGIPDNFLLDKDGKIVAKGLRGEALAQKLAEVYP